MCHREDNEEGTKVSWRLTYSRCAVSMGQKIGIKTKVLSLLGLICAPGVIIATMVRPNIYCGLTVYISCHNFPHL